MNDLSIMTSSHHYYTSYEELYSLEIHLTFQARQCRWYGGLQKVKLIIDILAQLQRQNSNTGSNPPTGPHHKVRIRYINIIKMFILMNDLSIITPSNHYYSSDEELQSMESQLTFQARQHLTLGGLQKVKLIIKILARLVRRNSITGSNPPI